MSAGTAHRAFTLAAEDLHHCLVDSSLDGITMLNEIASRYPQAVSFAPGWPPDEEFNPDQADYFIRRFTEYLAKEEGCETDLALGRRLFQYGPTAGTIRGLIARWLAADENIHVDPAAIVVTVGSSEAMTAVVRCLFSDPSDVLLVQSPSYFGVVGASRILGVDVVAVPEGPAGIEAATVERVCAEVRASGRRPRALYTIPDHANPSGLSLTVPARERLLEMAARENLPLIEDSPYRYFTRTGERLPTLKSLDTAGMVIYLGSFSKICAPGVRVGFAIADQPITRSDNPDQPHHLLADELAKVKSVLTVNTSPVTQAIIGGMLIDADYRLTAYTAARAALAAERLEAMLAALRRELGPMQEKLPELSWTEPDGGFFISLSVPFDADLAALEQSAAQFGVLWCPMSLFHVDGGGGRQMRLASSYASPERIDLGVSRLAEFIRHQVDS